MGRGISTNRNLTQLAECLKQQGVDFAFRYYSRTTKQPQKRLTPTEAKALCAAGLQLGVVYEDAPTDISYFSSERGHDDGVGGSQAASALGQPIGSAIYFAIDFDASMEDIEGPILDYFQGVNDGMMEMTGDGGGYAIGVYGSGAACDFLRKTCPFVQFAWLAESTGWLGSKTYSSWDVKQSVAHSPLCGLETDGYEDNQNQHDFGGFVLENVEAAGAP